MEMVNQFRTLIAGLFNNKQEKEERQGDGEVVKLKQENEELKRTVDTLTIKNREIQQLMVQKIRETDDWAMSMKPNTKKPSGERRNWKNSITLSSLKRYMRCVRLSP